jgi:hypothetical protein
VKTGNLRRSGRPSSTRVPQQVGFGEGAQEGPLLDPHVRESSTTTSSPSAQASFSCRNAVERCSDHAVARAAATTNTSSARRTTSGKVPNWRAPRANCQMPAKGRPSRSDPWANGATPQARHKTTCQASGIPKGHGERHHANAGPLARGTGRHPWPARHRDNGEPAPDRIGGPHGRKGERHDQGRLACQSGEGEGGRGERRLLAVQREEAGKQQRRRQHLSQVAGDDKHEPRVGGKRQPPQGVPMAPTRQRRTQPSQRGRRGEVAAQQRPGGCRWCAAGHDEAQQRVHDALLAIGRLIQRDAEFSALVGPGPQRKAVEELAVVAGTVRDR